MTPTDRPSDGLPVRESGPLVATRADILDAYAEGVEMGMRLGYQLAGAQASQDEAIMQGRASLVDSGGSLVEAIEGAIDRCADATGTDPADWKVAAMGEEARRRLGRYADDPRFAPQQLPAYVCSGCEQPVEVEAKRCPHCQTPNPNPVPTPREEVDDVQPF